MSESPSDEIERGVNPQEVLIDLSNLSSVQVDGLLLDVPPLAPRGPVSLREKLGNPVGRLSMDQCRAKIREAVTGKWSVYRNFMELAGKYTGRRLIIVGGGRSINDTLPDIRRRLRISKKTMVMALNKSHDWLLSKGVVPDFGVMCDPGEWVADYMTPRKGVLYLLASQLHDKTLGRFFPYRKSTYIWHCDGSYRDGSRDSVWANEAFPYTRLGFCGVGSTVGLLSITLAAVMGFDDVELHGYDSCFSASDTGNQLHAYAKPNTNQLQTDTTVRCKVTGHAFRFQSNADMARQALEFGDMMSTLPSSMFMGRFWTMPVRVAGDGVIPWLAWKRGDHYFAHATPERMRHHEGQQTVDFRPVWAKTERKP